MARRKSRPRKVVAVDWLDAKGDSGWSTEVEAQKEEPPLCTTVGVIVSRTKRKLVIAGTVGHGSDATVGDVNVIPAGMVRAVVTLGEILIEEDPAKEAKVKTRP